MGAIFSWTVPRDSTNSASLPPTKKSRVIAFHSSAEWISHFEASKQTMKLMVIDFTTTWCEPAQCIQPAVDDFAEKYADVEFIKIDADELCDVAEEYGIQVIPTFILMKKGKIVDKVYASKDELQEKIEKHRF